MGSDIACAPTWVAQHDVLDLEGAPVGHVLDLLVQKLGDVLALLIAQRGKGGHALLRPPAPQELANHGAVLILEHQLGINEARPFGTAPLRALSCSRQNK